MKFLKNLFLLKLSLSLSSQAAVVQATDHISGAGNDLAYAADVSTNDLINSGQPSLAAATSTPSLNPGGSDFQPENLNDGDYLNGAANVTFYDSSRLPATVTYDLDVSTFTMGYDISSIATFMGWSGVNGTQCNQVYTVEVREVGSATYNQIASVNYLAFPDSGLSTPYESKVVLTEDSSGKLATGVDSIRFIFSSVTGGSRGTVLREIDVNGAPTGTPTGTITISSPIPRQIFQRTPAGVGEVPLLGSYTDTVDAIEARLVVRSGGGNSGTSQAWQVIDASPSGGTFTGTLANVPEGGWYDLEMRSITGGVPSNVATIERIGIGDIYLIAGQSNSANWGSVALDPNDDRISVRTLPMGGSWVRATDPLPNLNPGRAGTGGSAWTRLGPLLTASENVPVGFLSLGIGNTEIAEWTPNNLFYNTHLRDAVQSFPQNGFKAILWHQGERDANDSTSYADYKRDLEAIIAGTRSPAVGNWAIPWFIAEASYQGASNLSEEEPIKAAQRAVAAADPFVFLGPSTDEFHLENAASGKLSDGVHFNEAGLADHAAQWFAILTNEVPVALENGDFEKNVDPTVTNRSALSENVTALTDINAGNSPSVLDWRILSADGQAAADGSNGFMNPGTNTYGVIDPPNLIGPHAAVLSAGTAGNYFLQATRARAVGGETYQLTASFGLRNGGGSEVYGNARMELFAGSLSLGSLSVPETALVAGEFTAQTLSVVAPVSVDGQELAVHIVKADGGANTYVDFDNVQLSLFAPTTGLVTATQPVEREIVQRDGANFGVIRVAGTYEGSVDFIEARAIVRSESGNSGTSIDWQTVDASPGGNAFSGSLTAVPAGGWYDVEFRSVTGGTPSASTYVEKVGVGDIYLVFGQSNSVNFGEPALDPADDRVSARTLPTGNEWVRAVDPLPNFDPGRGGAGGSTWTRLGPLLTASENVPIGFVSMGIGNSHVSEWISPNLFYLSRIKSAVQSFPAHGFKAILWHQGERDANLTTSAALYQSRLEGIIASSRSDATGQWPIPWYVAEASYQGSTTLTQEEPVKAGQRAVAFNDPLVFLGPSTDEFHLENAGAGKLHDGLHFSARGLQDHADQWFAILTRTVPTELENGGIEKNTDPLVTTQPPLAENAIAVTSITAGLSPSVIDWRILAADGLAAADGSNGYFNPGTTLYGVSSPTGVEGSHAAFLEDGTADNFFLQPTRIPIIENQTYRVTASFGLRSAGTASFGNARLEILSGNSSLAQLEITAADLVAGEFTPQTLDVTVPVGAVVGELGIKISKLSGAGTYVDFDNVSLTQLTPYDIWAQANGFGLPGVDDDGDGYPNLIEFALGDPSGTGESSIIPFTREGSALRVTRRPSAQAGVSYQVEQSTTLQGASWSAVPNVTETQISSSANFETIDLTIPGGWDLDNGVFYRLKLVLIE